MSAGLAPISTLWQDSHVRELRSIRKDIMQATMLPQTSPDVLSDLGTRGGKYLILHLVVEEFGGEVLKVREVKGIQDITAIPLVQAHIKGVVNLRGQVIPGMKGRFKVPLDIDHVLSRNELIGLTCLSSDPYGQRDPDAASRTPTSRNNCSTQQTCVCVKQGE